MTTLAEKRKDAIKIHEAKTKTIISELSTIAQSMRIVGLEGGAEKIDRIVSSVGYDLKTLMINASVNQSS